MKEQRLTPLETKTIAKQATGWRWKHGKIISEGSYISQLEGFDLSISFTGQRAPSGSIYGGDIGDPHYYIRLDIEVGGDNIGDASYTNNPIYSSSRNSKYLEDVLSRARVESRKEHDERINDALKKARDLVSRTRKIESQNLNNP